MNEECREEIPPTGQLVRAILFTDLSGFTPMTEAMGDHAAAGIVDRFSELVRDAAARHGGQVLKQIGDEFMVVFSGAGPTVACALDIERATSAEPNFSAVGSGAHLGPVLYREADCVGSNVNLAARVAAVAGPHQLVVTDAIRSGAAELLRVRFAFLERRPLKGLSEPIDLFLAEPLEERPTRMADPICGMELDPARAAAQLVWQGGRYWFCSPRSLQRFAAGPERYAEAASEEG